MFHVVERHLVTEDGVTTQIVLRFGDAEWELEVGEAQALAGQLVLAVDRVEPARWGR